MLNYHYLVRVTEANSGHFYVTVEQLNTLLSYVLPLGLKVLILDFMPASTHRISPFDKRLYNHYLSSFIK